MKLINYISMAMAVTALASCSNDDLEGAVQDASTVAIHATVGDAYTRSNPMGTAEEQKVFVNGDQLKVSTEGQTAATYTLSDTQWSATSALLWTSNQMTFNAWYPVDAAFESYTLPVDQTAAAEGNAFSKIAKADYMTCTVTQDKAEKLNLTFQRQTARVVVNVTLGDGFQGATINSVIIRANQQAGTGTESLAEFKAYKQDNKFTALVAPTTAKTEEIFMKLTVGNGSSQNEELTVKGIKALEKGKSHEFNVVARKQGLEITSVTITDWTGGTTVDVTPQALPPIVDKAKNSITMQTAGQLTTQLITDALAGGKKLIIAGPLNGADMRVLREATGCCYEYMGPEHPAVLITDLDMTDAQIVASNHAYYRDIDNNGELLKITEDNTFGKRMFNTTFLKSIKLPKSVTKVGDIAFRDSKELTEITLPNVTSYGIMVFEYCTKLATVHWGENTPTELPLKMFDECKSLVSIKIPSTVTTLGEVVFGSTGFTTFTIPATVKTIENQVFWGTPLKSITIPETVTSLGGAIFDNCKQFETITIACDKNKTTVSNDFLGLYQNSANVDLRLHKSFKADVTVNEQAQPMFEGYAFKTIYDLEGNNLGAVSADVDVSKHSISTNTVGLLTAENIAQAMGDGNTLTVAGPLNGKDLEFLRAAAGAKGSTPPAAGAKLQVLDMTNARILKGGTFNYGAGSTNVDANSLPISCFEGSILTSINLPQTLTRIEWQCFLNNKSLASIQIPKGVTSILWESFMGCEELTSITLPAELTSIDQNTFDGCKKITEIVIPSKVQHLYQHCFANTGLTSLVIPPTVLKVRELALENCPITRLTIQGPQIYEPREGGRIAHKNSLGGFKTEDCDLIIEDAEGMPDGQHNFAKFIGYDATTEKGIFLKGWGDQKWKSITDGKGKDLVPRTLAPAPNPAPAQ